VPCNGLTDLTSTDDYQGLYEYSSSDERRGLRLLLAISTTSSLAISNLGLHSSRLVVLSNQTAITS